jgi:hypothetical protein
LAMSESLPPYNDSRPSSEGKARRKGAKTGIDCFD